MTSLATNASTDLSITHDGAIWKINLSAKFNNTAILHPQYYWMALFERKTEKEKQKEGENILGFPVCRAQLLLYEANIK